ncbi:MAG: hypothetical protein A2806_00215 [Candidatus Terrybacteria bacterium RIFCSPHIGHO2_01_FULL_48_17]|uniref:DUF5673 domain-containing protein n=1 Tax=Candidatus Terrybacteria bacterium RIFCSPHIGHO2_01_FULL_48_17 TaxID=1802362 RepID=A0A1G2PJR0_9BACT|nr:MAG: hypothetical protein A2806_00215 [Candidatus Terrybacteria bacterium RIFCSPHIGHO2_01_FULL_48_17]OHA53644.1 MAG: hypothetical protein A3A30_00535 [Candidatus Terrybacteria bacterium RIFCSPLOWO2_01_FULL_48_14]
MPQKILDLRKKPDEKKPALTTQAIPPEPQKQPLVLQWEAAEFPSRPKDSASWMMATGFVAFIALVFFIFSRNFFGIILVVVGAVVWLLYAFRPAHSYTFHITPRGLEIGKKLFKFEDLQSFWIFYDPPDIKELAIRRKGLLVPELIIPLGKQDPVLVRRALLTFIPEVEQKYSALDLFLRRIGF